MKRYFEFVGGTSKKFWEVWLDGSKVHTRYGRIGAAGQTTVKNEGTPEKAAKLHDKLVREKTGKGYVEKKSTTKKPKAGGGWSAIVAAADLPAALEDHFAFLCDTPKCKPLLREICAHAISAKVKKHERDKKVDALYLAFKQDDGHEIEVVGRPPFAGKTASAPKSFVRFANVHNMLAVGRYLDFWGFRKDGTMGSGGFEQFYLEEEDPELFEKAKRWDSPIDFDQDWLVYNPFKKNKKGEPTLFRIYHGGGIDHSVNPPELNITGVFLRLMHSQICG